LRLAVKNLNINPTRMIIEAQTMGQWIARTNDCKESLIQAEVTSCTRQNLLPLAFKKIGMFWGAGLLCVFIPVFHFVLVPLFLLIGIIAFFKTLKFKYQIAEGFYNCPACTEKNILKNMWFQDELRSHCEKCRIQIVILEK
jgi:hypothetical protein